MSDIQSPELQSIPGFEGTQYAYLNGSIVWAGSEATTQHPRHAQSPWRPEAFSCESDALVRGALMCLSLFKNQQSLEQRLKGLMLWLCQKEMPFPLNLSVNRFEAIKTALECNDLEAFTKSTLRVIGLGNGLTPSGDDFVGGILFALNYAPRIAWLDDMPTAISAIRAMAAESTNVISAALLEDMIAGKSYSVLHDVLHALPTTDIARIKSTSEALLSLGASSGADMLAGMLLAITTNNTQPIH